MRKVLLKLHKYAGLIFGVLLSLIGVSGSLLVFDHAIDEALTPELRSDPSAVLIELESVINAAREAAPSEATLSRLYLSRAAGSPHVARFPGGADDGKALEVSIAPDSADVLAVRVWGNYPMTWLYSFHHSLTAGQTGKYIVGTMGIALLFFCLSGIVIWWPRRGQWRGAMRIERHKGAMRLNYDLHKFIGIFFSVLLGLSAFTGIGLIFHGPMEAAVNFVSPVTKLPSPSSSPRNKIETQVISADIAVAKASAIFPGATLKRIYLPNSDTASYQLLLTQSEEAWTNYGASKVWVDQYTGEVLASWNPLTAPMGNKFLIWQFPLHSGDALGLGGRWLLLITGITPTVLFGSGVYLWWKKRQRRISNQRRNQNKLSN